MPDAVEDEVGGAALTAPAERYCWLKEISRGGVGVILGARDPVIGRKVAIKVLRPDLEKDERQGVGHAALHLRVRPAQELSRVPPRQGERQAPEAAAIPVADSAICVGAALLVLAGFRSKPARAAA